MNHTKSFQYNDKADSIIAQWFASLPSGGHSSEIRRVLALGIAVDREQSLGLLAVVDRLERIASQLERYDATPKQPTAPVEIVCDESDVVVPEDVMANLRGFL